MTRAVQGLFVALALVGAFFFASKSLRAQELDLDVVFRCSTKGADAAKQCKATREMIIGNCTVCHTFVPIVMQQFEPSGWDGLLARHVSGGRVTNLKPEQIKVIRDFLVATFNTSNPPPELPQELLDNWTSY
jgi:hypothetical protein